MSRRLERLEPAHLPELGCARGAGASWQVGPGRRLTNPADAESEAGWVRRVSTEWGTCGRVVYVDDRLVGHLIWAPAAYLPAAAGFATSPVSPDAVVLAAAHVRNADRRAGLGRLLVQTMAKDLIRRRDVRAVEAFGGSGGVCVVPTDFLLAVGFRIHRPHPTRPRLRMDLRQIVTVREELEHAWEQLLDRLPRPVQPEAPAGRT